MLNKYIYSVISHRKYIILTVCTASSDDSINTQVTHQVRFTKCGPCRRHKFERKLNVQPAPLSYEGVIVFPLFKRTIRQYITLNLSRLSMELHVPPTEIKDVTVSLT